ncbi:MAG TPA: hypothetical protein VF844_05760 [Ktedonobacteraceae bacterium]
MNRLSALDAALKFARALVRSRGQVADENMERVRKAGHSVAEIAEIVANAVLNIFTNYFNQVAQTEIDFPRVELLTPTSF